MEKKISLAKVTERRKSKKNTNRKERSNINSLYEGIEK